MIKIMRLFWFLVLLGILFSLNLMAVSSLKNNSNDPQFEISSHLDNSLVDPNVSDVILNTLTPDTKTFLPIIMSCYPGIKFIYVPPWGSLNNLQGKVASCIEPSEFRVAVYIFVRTGWWNKPTFADPTTSIQPNRTWSTDITTGGNDPKATKIAAFLIPKNYDPPKLNGAPTLPDELKEKPSTSIFTDRYRIITFSGYKWNVKARYNIAGPGYNLFSDEKDDVWVDGQGRLHITIKKRDGKWYSTEVFSKERFGYGVYRFTLASRVDQLDENVVLGLFTWDNNYAAYNKEIDIEIGKGVVEGIDKNAQFVVQPADTSGNLFSYPLNLEGNYSTHSFNWKSDHISFSSYQGRKPVLGDKIESWEYTNTTYIPPPSANARINLWLLDILKNDEPDNSPSNGQDVEVIIESFEFVPDKH